MALQHVTTTKVKTKKSQKKIATDFSEAERIEFVRKRMKLDAAKAKLKGLEDEVKKLEAGLLTYVDSMVADNQRLKLDAGQFVIQVGPKGKQVVGFNTEQIRNALDEDTFNAIITFTVEDLKRYLPGDVVEKVCSYELKRKRSITIEKAVLE